MTIASSNPACLALYNATLDYCHYAASTGSSAEAVIATAFTVIGIELLALGVVKGSDGLLRNAGIIKELVERCFQKQVPYQPYEEELVIFQDDPSVSNSPQHSEKPLWQRALKGTTLITGGIFWGTMGCFGLLSAYVLRSHSAHLGEGCLPLAEKSLSACSWTNDLIVGIVNQVIKDHFGG